MEFTRECYKTFDCSGRSVGRSAAAVVAVIGSGSSQVKKEKKKKNLKFSSSF